MEFVVYSVGPLQTNCYIVWDSETRKAVVIDPGGDKDFILKQIGSLGLSVECILLTHGHPDHCFYAGDLAEEFGVGVAMHEADLAQAKDEYGLAPMIYNMEEYVEIKPDKYLKDGDVIKLGDSEIRVMHTPGHSEGGLCFVADIGVFCGDTIFAESVGRTDFPGGSYEALMHSIRTRILTLDDSTVLFPGHGSETTVGAERKGNPFLQNMQS